MPPPEEMYCAQQIHVPPELPDILKQFTKAAIRTQPRDVLTWASAYFHAKVRGEPLPVKERLEMPVATQRDDTGLTPGLLRTLHTQMDSNEWVAREVLEERWVALCLPVEQLSSLLALGSFGPNVEWIKFFALACSSLGGTLARALQHACELLSTDPEGGAARVPVKVFEQLYSYLAEVDGDIPHAHVDAVLLYLQAQADRQDGLVMPRNLNQADFPGLTPA
ncbi:ropporin-1-like protein isoform X1 [Petromyzon marinus]|uniref:Ropporin-1-like protein isoform X1 n=1 Tax=Petromyzon marinus TaxID=7757 RepID=A0AAJ7SY83_PETMA|nr:ropporin-1-like protein isoform X1 [Petromyzon marinus]